MAKFMVGQTSWQFLDKLLNMLVLFGREYA